jgi:hypothetical protein
MSRFSMSRYNHGEAYHLMEYVHEATGDVEWLWNSRDGVTPFIIRGELGAELVHKHWNRDVTIPHFVPPVGMRVFIDMTKEALREYKRRFVEKYKEDMLANESFKGKTDEEMVEMLVEGEWQKGMPDVVVVTPELQAKFQEAARNPSPSAWPKRFA